jgi:L-asparaginase
MVASKKPRVYLIGTGGTISYIGRHRSDYIDYTFDDKHLSIQELLDRIPEANEICDVYAEQYLNLGSFDFGPTHWPGLANRINQIFREDPKATGVAITHGTATLEETAYFLNLTVKSRQPVVVTGSQRPPTALATDADLNLLDAIRVAAAPEAVGRGVLTILNNEIQAARDSTKTDSYRLEAFKSNELGLLGYSDSDGQVVFYRNPTRRHTLESEFEVEADTNLPRVDIANAYAGVDGVVVGALAEAGVAGIVIASLGGVTVPSALTAALRKVLGLGIKVVMAIPAGSGRVMQSRHFSEAGFIVADNLTPKKARILLMLALTKTKDTEDIQRMMLTY